MIFVSIASYMDTELPKTVDDLLKKSKHPENIVIGIVEQNAKGRFYSFDHLNNVKKKDVVLQNSKGAGYARKLAMEMYDGEDYFLQIDSHMRFENNWDEKMINILNQAQEISGTKKVILSQYPAPYFVGSDNNDYFPKQDKDYWDAPSWSKVANNASGQWSAKRQKMKDLSKPHKSHTVLAGYIFSIGKLVEEVPYDERISFMGEELCFAIRAYTRGWEIFAPNKMLLYHFYKRSEYPKLWNTGSLKSKWFDFEKQSNLVQESVLTGMERGVYGVEDYERFLDYQDMIGIDFFDFYHSSARKFMENMSVIEQEIYMLDTPAKSRYCINDLHNDCKSIQGCQCDCHRKGK